MKIFFASLTDPSIEVDAWVPTVQQGQLMLSALASKYSMHSIIMRARVKRFHNVEERFIGLALESSNFLMEVGLMGLAQPKP